MLVKTLAHGRLVLERFMRYPRFAADTETQAKEQYAKDKKSTLIIGRYVVKIWSMCYRGEAYSFPTNLISPKYPTMMEWVELFEPLFQQKLGVFHNFNYDGNAFLEYGATFRRIWDTLLGCHAANANYDRDLKSRANLYGRYLAQTSTVDFSDLDALAEYAEDDVIATDELAQMQLDGVVRRPKIIQWVNDEGIIVKARNPIPELWCKPEHEGLDQFHRDLLRFVELPILRAVIRAEQRGFLVKREELKRIRKQIKVDNLKLLTKIYQKARKNFQLSSNKQLAQTLQELGIELVKKTKKGAVSVAYDSLFFVQDQHPIVADIIKHKQNAKLLSVYAGEKGIEHYLDKKGRVHATINTVGARTGRTSSSNPNLQNLPAAKDTYGIRSCFVAPKGQSIICLDFSQIEIRVMAIFSKDEAMSTILRDPKGDIHQLTADQFNVPRSPVAKQINFLQLYAGGSYAMANKLTLEGAPTTPEIAQTYIDKYNDLYPGVQARRKEWLREMQRHGYVRYLLGNRRYLLDVDWSKRREMHKAETTISNNLCQGSAQLMLKCAIVRSDPLCINPDRVILARATRYDISRAHKLRLQDYAHKLEKLRREFLKAKLRWLMQVHDENLYTVDKYAAAEIGHKVADIMTWIPYFEPITSISVPVLVDGGVGESWKEAKSKTPQHKLEASGIYWE